MHGRGATSATSRFASIGSRSSRPEKNRSCGANHSGNIRVVDSMPSPLPRSPAMRHGRMPPTPVRIAITGYSRGGKMATIAAARIARDRDALRVDLRERQQVVDDELRRPGALAHRGKVEI